MTQLFKAIVGPVALGLAFLSPAAAQIEAQPATPAATTIPASPAMWRAADEDTEVYFLGTFHILPPNVDWRTPAFEEAFEAASTVYFEVDSQRPSAIEMMRVIIEAQGHNPNGVLLTSMLSPSDGVALKSISESVGLPFSFINTMRPWNAFLNLSFAFIVKQGFEPGAGVDSVLLTESRLVGKNLRFFETMEQQLSFFTQLSPEDEKSLLEITIRDWDSQIDSFDDLFNAWRLGDANFIDTEMNRAMRDEAPAVFETVIVERNKAWTDEIAARLETEKGVIFVAVGTAHLTGDYSVPAMLKARGITVERYGMWPANDNAGPTAAD